MKKVLCFTYVTEWIGGAIQTERVIDFSGYVLAETDSYYYVERKEFTRFTQREKVSHHWVLKSRTEEVKYVS